MEDKIKQNIKFRNNVSYLFSKISLTILYRSNGSATPIPTTTYLKSHPKNRIQSIIINFSY